MEFFVKREEVQTSASQEVSAQGGDFVWTDDIGRGFVDFGPSQGLILLNEETHLELVSLRLGLLVRVLQGSIEVLKAPESSRIAVEFPDTEIQKLTDLKGHFLSRAKDGKMLGMGADSFQLPKTVDLLDQEGSAKGDSAVLLSQDFLENSLLRLRPQLLKCYSNYVANHLKKETISVLATITYSGGRGGVQDVGLSSKENLDVKLESCIKETLKSLNLSPYRGHLIDIELPIILE
jgi:hypothetical protein